MKKINETETRNINGGCSYSGFNGHRAIKQLWKKQLYFPRRRMQYCWLCGCGKRFYTYSY